MAKFQAGACKKGLPASGTQLVREEAICLVQHLWVLWCSCFKQEPWFPVVWVEMEEQGGQQPLLLPFCRPQGMGEWECSLGNGVCKSFWGVWCCSFLQLNEITFYRAAARPWLPLLLLNLMWDPGLQLAHHSRYFPGTHRHMSSRLLGPSLPHHCNGHADSSQADATL